MAAHNMTEGNIAKHLIRFAIPMILGNLFQLTYNAVDSIIVGRWLGMDAVAAVGAANPIMNVAIFFIGGICMGASVLMSQYFGAKDYDKLKREISTTLIFGIVFTVFVTVVSFLLTKPILRVVGTPETILNNSANYLRIVFVGLIFTYLYNFFSNTLRSIGDSRTPLIFLIISSVLNILLDVLFVIVIGLGVPGAAIATVVSQAVSSTLCFLYIRRSIPLVHLTRKELVLDKGLLKTTIQFGWVTALQQTCIYLGRVFVQSAVNPLGIDSIAAFNAVSRVDDFAITPMQSIGSAMTTYFAQNKGANNDKRIGKGFLYGNVLSTCYWALLCLPVFFGAKAIMSVFVPESGSETVRLGMLYLHSMAFYYIMPAWTNAVQGYFRGMGKMTVTFISTFLQITTRVIFSHVLAPTHGIAGVATACLIGWCLMLAYEIPLYVYDRKKAIGKV